MTSIHWRRATTQVSRRRGQGAAWTAIVAGTAGAALALAGVQSPVRAPLVLIFLAVVPALAVAALLPGFDPLARLVVAGAAAVGIDVAVAEGMLASGTWSPRLGVAAVAAISALIVAGRALAARRIGQAARAH